MEDKSSKYGEEETPPAAHILNYRTPDEAPRSALATALAGFLAAVVFMGCGSALWYLRVNRIGGPSLSSHGNRGRLPVAVFAALAVAGITVAIFSLRHRPRNAWSMFFAGFAIGACMTALIEGACFATG